jgi:hypothetical protein
MIKKGIKEVRIAGNLEDSLTLVAIKPATLGHTALTVTDTLLNLYVLGNILPPDGKIKIPQGEFNKKSELLKDEFLQKATEYTSKLAELLQPLHDSNPRMSLPIMMAVALTLSHALEQVPEMPQSLIDLIAGTHSNPEINNEYIN